MSVVVPIDQWLREYASGRAITCPFGCIDATGVADVRTFPNAVDLDRHLERAHDTTIAAVCAEQPEQPEKPKPAPPWPTVLRADEDGLFRCHDPECLYPEEKRGPWRRSSQLAGHRRWHRRRKGRGKDVGNTTIEQEAAERGDIDLKEAGRITEEEMAERTRRHLEAVGTRDMGMADDDAHREVATHGGTVGEHQHCTCPMRDDPEAAPFDHERDCPRYLLPPAGMLDAQGTREAAGKVSPPLKEDGSADDGFDFEIAQPVGTEVPSDEIAELEALNPLAALQLRYVERLLWMIDQQAEGAGELDPRLADRVERILGIAGGLA